MRNDGYFPGEPDWQWLKTEFSGHALLHMDCPFLEVVRRIGGGRLAYLATPYSRITADETGMWDAAMSSSAGVEAAGWACRFAVEGVTAISPIVQSVEIVNFDGGGFERKIDPLDEAFWSRWCQPMLSASGAVVIPAMDGWDMSHGVWREACWALQHNVPVYLVAENSEFGGAS